MKTNCKFIISTCGIQASVSIQHVLVYFYESMIIINENLNQFSICTNVVRFLPDKTFMILSNAKKYEEANAYRDPNAPERVVKHFSN